MRAGKSITVSLADRRRLENRIDDRNVAQKYVWRAEIVLFTADGAGTNEIMRRTCKSKICVWRWQERFLEEGFEIKPLDGEAAADPNKIIAAVKRGHQVLDSIH